MKARLSILLVMAVSMVLATADGARASMTTIGVQAGDYVVMSWGSQVYQMGGESGGEFEMTVYASQQDYNSGTSLGSFYTFCADPTTMMDLGVLYKVNAVSDENHNDYVLSDYGKWIYYEYAQNDNGATVASSIPGHTSPDFTAEVAGAIQEGIWSQLMKDNVSVGLPDSQWDYGAYNEVSSDENWVADFNSFEDSLHPSFEFCRSCGLAVGWSGRAKPDGSDRLGHSGSHVRARAGQPDRVVVDRRSGLGRGKPVATVGRGLIG